MCNGDVRGGKGTPYEGGVRVPSFVFWPPILGKSRRETSAPAHMIDIFATLLVAALSTVTGKGTVTETGRRQSQQKPEMAAQSELLHNGRHTKLRHAAPDSLSLWPSLLDASATTATVTSAAHDEPPDVLAEVDQHSQGRRLTNSKGVRKVRSSQGDKRNGFHGGLHNSLHNRPVVLQLAASSGGVILGRYKLVLAAARCLLVKPTADHTTTINAFRADEPLTLPPMAMPPPNLVPPMRASDSSIGDTTRYTTDQSTDHTADYSSVPPTTSDHAVRLQLYDLWSDPSESCDLLNGSTHHTTVVRAAPGCGATVHERVAGRGGHHKTHHAMWSTTRELLRHYQTATATATRLLEAARREGRDVAVGRHMTTWFCQQLVHAWEPGRWSHTRSAHGICRDGDATKQTFRHAATATNLQTRATSRTHTSGSGDAVYKVAPQAKGEDSSLGEAASAPGSSVPAGCCHWGKGVLEGIALHPHFAVGAVGLTPFSPTKQQHSFSSCAQLCHSKSLCAGFTFKWAEGGNHRRCWLVRRLGGSLATSSGFSSAICRRAPAGPLLVSVGRSDVKCGAGCGVSRNPGHVTATGRVVGHGDADVDMAPGMHGREQVYNLLERSVVDRGVNVSVGMCPELRSEEM